MPPCSCILSEPNPTFGARMLAALLNHACPSAAGRACGPWTSACPSCPCTPSARCALPWTLRMACAPSQHSSTPSLSWTARVGANGLLDELLCCFPGCWIVESLDYGCPRQAAAERCRRAMFQASRTAGPLRRAAPLTPPSRSGTNAPAVDPETLPPPDIRGTLREAACGHVH